MEVAEITRRKTNQRVRHQQQPGELRKQQHREARLIEENEKMVEELQHQMFYIERQIPEKQLNLDYAKSKARCTYTLDYGWSYKEKMIYRNSELDIKKMELEKLTFAHGAYRDKKAVLYFSAGREPEVNIHHGYSQNLNYRMLHEARSMGGERRLLNMANPNKHSNSGSSLKQLDQQVTFINFSIRPYSLFLPFHCCCCWYRICWLGHDLLMKWRLNSISDLDKTRKKLMELEMEREQLFRDAPVKGFLWNSLPSTTNLRKQVQALESSKEKRIKVISWKKEIDLYKSELRKAENEIKSLRRTMEKIRQKKQKALQTLSHLKESSQEPL
ncbi:hypothetical protein F2Q68_00013197 [Brassica cretica]|uniref:Uncharacterized protein n=1 Tax=Brassica cretica TaxID=69181 RepID=A0A8S9HI62_BRACR|nr:hypothetical protein F2Q68_00013197 [Brassica cretica]